MSESINLSLIGQGNTCAIYNKDIKEPTFSVDDAVNNAGYGKFQIKLLFLAGLGWAADACEVFILSVIGNLMACDWPELRQWQIAMLTSVVFGGIMVGSPILGIVADKYGRKRSLCVAVLLMCVTGAASAASPSFVWMVVLRGCMGLALGGLSQGLVLTTEYCPPHMRGKAGFYLCYFWSVGTVGVILLAWLVMEYVGSWRVLLAVVCIPCLIVAISLPWYPESARFYLVSGQHDEAEAILGEMSRMNGRPLPPGRLTRLGGAGEEEKRGQLGDLLRNGYGKTSVIFWYIWFATAFAYYGIALLSPAIIQRGSLLIDDEGGNSSSEALFLGPNDPVPCSSFTQKNYIDLLWTSAAEFPGLLLFGLLVERCRRKVLLGASCIITSILILLLMLRTHKIVILLVLFAARGISLALFQLIYIVASETYPTTFRSVAIGFGSAFCRIGGIVVPYVAQVLALSSPVAAVCLLAGTVFLSGIAAFLLPFETRGKGMKDSQRE